MVAEISGPGFTFDVGVSEYPSPANQIPVAFRMSSSFKLRASSPALPQRLRKPSLPTDTTHSFILTISPTMVLPRTSAFGSMFRSSAARSARLRSTSQTWRTASRRTYASGHGPAKKSSDLPWFVNPAGQTGPNTTANSPIG
jgi:hypothetical protein